MQLGSQAQYLASSHCAAACARQCDQCGRTMDWARGVHCGAETKLRVEKDERERHPPKTMAVDERAALAELKRRVGCVCGCGQHPGAPLTAGSPPQSFARRPGCCRRCGRRVPPLPGRPQVGCGQGGGTAARHADLAERAVPGAELPGPCSQLPVWHPWAAADPAAAQATPPRARLALVRSLLPGNPHLGFSKEGWPVTLINVGASDPARAAQELTGEDLVRRLAPSTPAEPPTGPPPADAGPVCARAGRWRTLLCGQSSTGLWCSPRPPSWRVRPWRFLRPATLQRLSLPSVSQGGWWTRRWSCSTLGACPCPCSSSRAPSAPGTASAAVTSLSAPSFSSSSTHRGFSPCSGIWHVPPGQCTCCRPALTPLLCAAVERPCGPPHSEEDSHLV